MLSKKNRVDKDTVEKIFKTGRFVNSPNLSFKFILDKNFPTPRISFIVPKKVAKSAVERNFLRRYGYLALQKYFHQFPAGILGVFVFNKNSIENLENEIKNILNKIN